jgi:hypothetical protein
MVDQDMMDVDTQQADPNGYYPQTDGYGDESAAAYGGEQQQQHHHQQNVVYDDGYGGMDLDDMPVTQEDAWAVIR